MMSFPEIFALIGLGGIVLLAAFRGREAVRRRWPPR